MNAKRFTLIGILCATIASLSAQEDAPFRVMSWNVENLFDLHHDTLKNDREFLPHGEKQWNDQRYKKKLNDLARVITGVGEWNPPALVGLCEVENDRVLHHLTRYSSLKEQDYRYVMTCSPDERGIDVALLYQRHCFKLLSHRSIGVGRLNEHTRPTRDLLHVSGELLTGDTLDVFVCHFPSRSGGAKESTSYRLFVARKLRSLTDSLMNCRQHPQLLLMGDFNDYPQNASIAEVLEAAAPPLHPSPHKLYHLLAHKARQQGFGSYKYQGEWGLLDHLIVSGTLLDASKHFFTTPEQADVVRLPFLLMEDEKYGGVRPFSTYYGRKYQGGYSDHLPLYADFTVKRK